MTRAAARALGNAGVQEYAAHNYSGAVDKLERAYHALPVPSLGLWSARALAQTGKLVAASERYLEVTRLDVKGGDLAIQKQAQADAESDRAALLPRIPNLVIQVEHAPAGDLELVVNGTTIPSSLVGTPVPMDPGDLAVEGHAGQQTARASVTLRETETKNITLSFEVSAEAAPGPSNSEGTGTGAGEPPAPHRSSSAVRTAGFVTLSLGGAALVGGVVTGVLAKSKSNSATGQCTGTVCPTAAESNFDSASSLAHVTNILWIGGGVLAATGLTLVLVGSHRAEDAPAAARVELAPLLGPGNAGLFASGAF
jgi:hypothetical protein